MEGATQTPPEAAPSASVRRWGIAGVLLLAAAVRLWHIDWGLPYALLFDETIYMNHALSLRTRGGTDPGSFFHSHLLTTQDLACQSAVWACRSGSRPSTPAAVDLRADPVPYYLATRAVTVVVSLATVLLLCLMTRRSPTPEAGLLAAGLLALNPLHVAQSNVAVPDVHLALLVLAALGCARAAVAGLRAGPLLIASACVGLAAAAKYNGVFLGLVPAACLLLMRRGLPGHRWVALGFASAACMGLGYALGNPYAVLHPKHAYIGFMYLRRVVSEPHFWQEPGGALAEYCTTLGPEVGLFGAVSLAVLLVRPGPDGRKPLVPGLLFLVFFFAYMSHAPVHFPRFVLPLLAPLCLFVAEGSARAVRWAFVGLAARRAALVGLFVLLAARGVVDLVRTEARKGRGDTRVVASRWAEANLPEGAVVATEGFGIKTPAGSDFEPDLATGPGLSSALRRFGGRPLRIVRLPWSVGEEPLAHYVETGVDYIVFSDWCRDRVFADPSLGRMRENYLEVERGCDLVARFEPRTPEGLDMDGPTIFVYRVRH